MNRITPKMILNAYANGLFPMADSADSTEIYWYDPLMRGQLSIDKMHVPRRLQKTILKHDYDIKFNTAFKEVMLGCAELTKERSETWINKTIIDLFVELHDLGFAHSVEVWSKETGSLIGGVYGIAIGSAFFGESMFSRATDASKIALVHLVAYLWKRNYTLFDTQYINEHLKQFGVEEIPQAIYKQKLENAVQADVSFYSDEASGGVSETVSDDSLSTVTAFLQSINQTSKIG